MEDRGSSRSDLIKDHGEPSPLAVLTPLAPGRGVLFPPSLFPPCSALLPPVIPHSQEDLWQLPGRLRINPSLWDKEDVCHWLHWAQREYSLLRTERGRFEMNGRALCLLTKEDFRRRCPDSGDVLYELLQCVKQQRRGVACGDQTPLTLTLSQPPLSLTQLPPTINTQSHQTNGSQGPRPLGAIVSTDVSKCPPTIPSSQEEEPLNLSNQERPQIEVPPREANGKIQDCRLLWDYVYQLLSDQRYQPFIRWEDQESLVFRVVDPNGLARLWGNHKNRANMTYEKMSRALRHYYKLNIIKKEPGQKLLFRFLKTPQEIKRHRVDRLDSADSPEHTHTPSHTLRRDFSEDGLELSPEYSPPISNP
ncbi:transcription factor ETV7 [Coregonus clupeaformis]|uniref:transcription factor ETV7 n=1 Tax=Coregonus clupeaformis TaxID=59861 RepID=UPI001BE0C3D6|nr:transcription factor ETV7 [Coregonus clupeaformis]XP_041692020.1 transcription factor ETV7 [Coregonus clupeaformis]